MTLSIEIFQQLHDYWQKISNTHLNDMFKAHPQRFDRFSLSHDDLIVDFSKERIDQSVWNNLIELARASDIERARDDMFAGEAINTTEGRAVMHIALRGTRHDGYTINGTPCFETISHTLERFLSFADDVIDGKIKNAQGERFTDVINIGIGGSDLGPVMATRALAPFHNDKLRVHFVANVDGTDFYDTVKYLNPRQTLILIASKTFTTIETMQNAQTAKAWLAAALGEDNVAGNLVALSTNLAATDAFGIPKDRVFGFWDWVGGRYSMCSAIGLSIALAIGSQQFRNLLAGFRDMDQHFKNAKIEENIPIMMALIGIWRRNIMGLPTTAIIPYDQRLESFPAYLQQMEMESNGKSVAIDGGHITRATAPVIWGASGSNAQHSFFQMLHQGTDIIPVDFMIAAQPIDSEQRHHDILLSNFLAQSEALAFGRDEIAVRGDMNAKGISPLEIDQRAPHCVFAGNRPSTSIIYRQMTPFALGRLIALYEHKVFVQGKIWGINSFDQWGVELGKVVALKILPKVTGTDNSKELHPSTASLLAQLKQIAK